MNKKLIEKGRELLASVPAEEAEETIRFIIDYIVEETRIGLGLVHTEESVKTPIFDKIDDVYREASKIRNCYFCSGTDIDPNDEEFNKDTHVCMYCTLKLANYTKAMGIEPRLIFPLAGERRVQKSTMILTTGMKPEKMN